MYVNNCTKVTGSVSTRGNSGEALILLYYDLPIGRDSAARIVLFL